MRITHWFLPIGDIVWPQGIEKVTIQLIDTPTKVYAIGARLFLSKVPLEVLQNWVLIQLIVTPHILGKVQGQIKEVCRLIEPCLLIGIREYIIGDVVINRDSVIETTRHFFYVPPIFIDKKIFGTMSQNFKALS